MTNGWTRCGWLAPIHFMQLHIKLQMFIIYEKDEIFQQLFTSKSRFCLGGTVSGYWSERRLTFSNTEHCARYKKTVIHAELLDCQLTRPRNDVTFANLSTLRFAKVPFANNNLRNIGNFNPQNIIIESLVPCGNKYVHINVNLIHVSILFIQISGNKN